MCNPFQVKYKTILGGTDTPTFKAIAANLRQKSSLALAIQTFVACICFHSYK